MKRVLMMLLVFIILMMGLLVLRFGSALTQEGNPLPILSSIMDLEFSDSAYEEFEESEARTRFVSENTGELRHAVMTEFMEEKGWAFEDQLGAGLVFAKDGESLVIETRQFTKHYILWDVPGEVLD